ncbi:MAG: anaerobic sulfatase maturase [Anaerolineae bacterium]|nr:anaerobic sulfatase maturase [Anaerolineae bacterium]
MAQRFSPPRFQVLAKPTGAACNLACSYCFFLDKELLYPGSSFRMSAEVLERYIEQLIAAHRSSEVTISWQGGEPTLMGLDFFRRAVALQDKYRRPGMTFENTLQTNGTLLDDEWCEFFRANNYLIGISLDGPPHIHNVFRVDRGGAATYDRVMRGIRLLQEHRVDYNILATVNRISADHPQKIYRFLRDEVGTQWIQFIPVIERMNPDGRNLIQVGERVSPRSVRPVQFGRFLIQVFDEWVQHDVGQIFVQTFEAALRNWMRLSTSGMCVFEKTCGIGLALEHNGDLYSCDHFVEPDHLLGNIIGTSMQELVSSERQTRFGQAKYDRLPRACLMCPVLFACNGECPKNRFLTTQAGEPGLNYLCAGYKAFFQRADEPMKIMALLMNDGRPASEVMEILASSQEGSSGALHEAKPGDPCPCKSGLLFKECHGWRRTRGDGKRSARPFGGPRPPVRKMEVTRA